MKNVVSSKRSEKRTKNVSNMLIKEQHSRIKTQLRAPFDHQLGFSKEFTQLWWEPTPGGDETRFHYIPCRATTIHECPLHICQVPFLHLGTAGYVAKMT